MAVAVGHSAPRRMPSSPLKRKLSLLFSRHVLGEILFVFIFALAAAASSARPPVAAGRRQRFRADVRRAHMCGSAAA